MKLHDTATAPNPRRVRIFLAEKGIEVPTEQVDIVGMANRQPEFLARNPLGGVPVLELDDGTCIAESMAICRYFEVLQPEPPLMGRSPLEQATIEMWNRRMELALLAPVAAVFQHGHPFFKGRIEQVPDYADACRRTVASRLAWLDEAMRGRAFVAGDDFTVADITALCAVDFARVSKIRLDDAHATLRAWHERVSARPSAGA